MKIKLKKISPWLFCKNKHAASYSKYKLHAFLPITHFDTHQKEVYDLLYKAVEDGIIPEFKILNIGGSDELTQEIVNVDTSIEQNPNARLLNSPFTIYLYEDFDPQLLMELCRQIEDKLHEIPGVNRQLLSIADLPLTAHITFRQETLDGEYVKIAGTQPELLERLRNEADSSPEYRALTEKVNALENKPSNKLDPDKEKEDYVRGFFNSHFKYYKRKINSENIHDQFHGSCILLGLNPDDLLKLAGKENWDKLINHAYRLLTRKFHSDAIKNKRFSDTTKKANKIFNLAKNAQNILSKIAEDPKIIDKKKILEQERYLPEYQYQLKDGFNSDPYFYIHMARDPSRYILVKNWDFQIVPEALGEKKIENLRREVVLFRPELKIYKGDERKTIDLPGYQAFYYLLVANALPRRFDRGHFMMIFRYGESESSISRESWLMAQGLTTPEFFLYFKSDELINFAIDATKKGFVDIGHNEYEVFLYYFTHHPDTVQFIPKKNNEVMKEKLVKYIMDNPDNLSKLERDILAELAQWDVRIKDLILSNKLLTLELSSEFIENKILAPCFKNIESQVESATLLNKLSREIIAYMLKGDNGFIPLLSDKKLYELKKIFAHGLPSWMTEVVNEELLMRSGIIEVFNNQEKQNGYWLITPKSYIKNAFLKDDNTITEDLNKETLIWLAAQPEVHWSNYLPIYHALIALNEKKTALSYLQEMAKELGVDTNFKGLDEFISELTPKRLHAINQDWRMKRVEHLQEQYDQLLKADSESLETPSDILKQLRNLGVQTSSYSAAYHDRLKEKFFILLDRLKAGEKSQELLNKFNELKGKVNDAGFDWKGVSEKDKENNWLIGGQVFSLMKAIISVNDNNAYLLGSGDVIKERFGINPNEKDIVIAFKQVYFLYECLSVPQEFYRHLSLNLGRNEDDSSNFTQFDVDFIKDCLLKFADNEFAVFIDGQREAAQYKHHRFIDYQNIRDFKEIHNLYLRLGEEKHFNDLLTNAFQRLLEAHKKNKASGQTQASASLLTYIKMRMKIDIICPQFENILIQNSISRIVKNEYRLLNHKFFNSSNNRAIALRDNIASLHREPDFLIDEELSTKTHLMLIELKNFLSSYSNSPLYNNLLDQVISDPILKHYLKIIGIDVTEQDKKKLSKEISTLPDSQLDFPQVNLLMLDNVSHQKEKEKSEFQVNKESKMDLDIMREKIKKAIFGADDESNVPSQGLNLEGCYLDWMKMNAQGTRGLTRFSHWFHGDSGVKRAKELLELVNDSTCTYQDIVNKLATCVSRSSNTKHSLKSYLIREFGKENLNDILGTLDERIFLRNHLQMKI